MVINVDYTAIFFCQNCNAKLKLAKVKIDLQAVHLFLTCKDCNAEYEVLYTKLAERRTLPPRNMA